MRKDGRRRHDKEATTTTTTTTATNVGKQKGEVNYVKGEDGEDKSKLEGYGATKSSSLRRRKGVRIPSQDLDIGYEVLASHDVKEHGAACDVSLVEKGYHGRGPALVSRAVRHFLVCLASSAFEPLHLIDNSKHIQPGCTHRCSYEPTADDTKTLRLTIR